jgi:uracil-DNA glycosylase family 4
MSAAERMDAIRQKIKTCQECSLHQGRKHAVPGEGPINAQVMCIGEGPGFHENEQGKPFVGQAGKFLDELLASSGLKREDVFITNVVKCRPPSNRDPEPQELAACGMYLDEQIELINPKVIVTLGRFSMARFIDGGRISQIHGETHEVEGRTVITMYHPAAALHQPALRGALLSDFAHLNVILNHETKVETPTNLSSLNANAADEPEAEQLSLF